MAFTSMDYLKPGELNPVSPLSANYLLFQPEETRGGPHTTPSFTLSTPSPRVPVHGVKEHLTPSSCSVLRDAPKAIPLRSDSLKIEKKATAFFSDCKSGVLS